MELFEKNFLWGISPQELVLGVAIVLQTISIGRHFRLAEFSGWLKPFRLYAIMITLMMVPRILSQMALYGLIAPETSRDFNSLVFLVDSVLACWAPWALMREIRGQFSKTALVNTIPDGLVQVDLHGDILSANKALCDMVHYTETQLIGQPLHALLHHILLSRQVDLPVEISLGELDTKEGKQLVGLIRKITKAR